MIDSARIYPVAPNFFTKNFWDQVTGDTTDGRTALSNDSILSEYYCFMGGTAA